MTEKWDIVIVGGGLAGYVAATYLARTDLSILVLEKGGRLGGRAGTNKIKQQYLNVGPHALAKKGIAKSVLEELGIRLSGKSPKVGGILVENDLEYAAPFSPLELFTTRLLNPRERMEWIAVLWKVMNTNPDNLAEQTFQQWVTQVAYSERCKQLLHVLGRLSTYCNAPETASAKVMLSSMKQAMKGVLYLDGGWQTIIGQLHRKAVSSGVQVRTRTPVKQIVPLEQDHFKLILVNDEDIHAKYVICTTGPQELDKMLNETMSLDQKRFLDQITAVRGATLDLALTQLPDPGNLFAMGLTDPLYYSVHSTYARLSDDPKNVVLHVFKYHHPADQVDEKRIKDELEQLLDQLQPGWQQYMITKRFIPDITVNQRLPQVGDEQKLQRFKTGVPGVYIAGDWASPHSILSDAAVSSGKQAAEEIILNEKRKHRADHGRRVSAI